MKRKVSYSPKFNFHNSSPITIIIDDERTENWSYADENFRYIISKRQAKRISDHFCGMRECRCPKGEITDNSPEGDSFLVPARNCK
jgi:hypothetical protein